MGDAAPHPLPAALLWDVDGTLAETEGEGHLPAFNQTFEQAGLPWRWSRARYAELLHITGGRERMLHDMASQPAAPRDAAEREALAERLHPIKNRLYAERVAQGHVQARPGVLALMREAQQAGVRQAIVTTTSTSNVAALLQRLLDADWAAQFDAVVCGEDAARKKPDPEAYLVALERLGLSAHEALAFEDSSAGLAAAKAAGLRCVWRPSALFGDVGGPLARSAAVYRCTDDAAFNWTDVAAWWRGA